MTEASSSGAFPDRFCLTQAWTSPCATTATCTSTYYVYAGGSPVTHVTTTSGTGLDGSTRQFNVRRINLVIFNVDTLADEDRGITTSEAPFLFGLIPGLLRRCGGADQRRHQLLFTAVVNPASNTGQTGALNESYADIMGNLIERKPRSDSGRWHIGEDSDAGSVRTMAAPASYRQYAADGDVHANSAIFGSAADQMMNDSDTAAITERSFRPSRMPSMPSRSRRPPRLPPDPPGSGSR